MNNKNILDYETVELLPEENAVQIIDQTLLPGKTELIKLRTAKEIWDAIYLLKVRGAPAIGVAAALGIYILVNGIAFDGKDGQTKADTPENYPANYDYLCARFMEMKDYLASSRPTAVNLFWALNRMEAALLKWKDREGTVISDVKDALCKEAQAIREEDIAVCRSIGEYGLTLVKPGDGILTHCNAGQLATIKYGTATAPIYLGHERGYNFHVYCDETRPLLQGARLTAYELASAGIDVTLECDNMVASIMKEGRIQAVFVGCDRVASNGDAANKIGTSVVAMVAARYHVPFYVCAPTSTIDMSLASGSEIPIEQRNPDEVTQMWYEKRMAPENIKVYNPAFDVTDAELITGIITEYGIARAPYAESLKEIFAKKAEGTA